MRRLRVTEAHDYDLVGELVDAPEHIHSVVASQSANPFPIFTGPSPAYTRGSAI
jgi:hypothetical protein